MIESKKTGEGKESLNEANEFNVAVERLVTG